MKYVPNLIPEKSKVLKGYFKGNIHQRNHQNQFLIVLGWIFGISLFISALVSIIHPPLFLIYTLLGFILLPPGHMWIEKKFRFKLTIKIKSVLVAILIIIVIPLKIHYIPIDREVAYQYKLKIEKEKKEKREVDSLFKLKIEKEKEEAERIERQRKDSLNFYIQESINLKNEHKTDKASKKLDYAIVFATTEEDKGQIANEQLEIKTIKTFDFVKSGKYKPALIELDSLILKDRSNSQLFYNRAICLSKLGKIQEAVNDCKAAMQMGNKEADQLYNKINPIRKRVAYYVTRCCDGTTSSATGRGACSHHGGVCNWNEPVYEEYRNYE
jgi:tetratricopeptide (TPR) repeat protein